MPFRRGKDAADAAGKRRKRAGGRPTKEVSEANQRSRELARMMVDRDTEKLVRKYLKRAMESDRVLVHVIDKLIPPFSRAEVKVTEERKPLDVAALDALRATPEGRAVCRRQAELIVKEFKRQDRAARAAQLGEGPQLDALRRQWELEDEADERPTRENEALTLRTMSSRKGQND